MSEQKEQSNVLIKWAPLIVLFVGQVLMLGIAYGTLNSHIENLERRVTSGEKKQEENLIPRNEYDKRHDDLMEQVRELRREIKDLERKNR